MLNSKKLLLTQLTITFCLIQRCNKFVAFCNPFWDFIKFDKLNVNKTATDFNSLALAIGIVVKRIIKKPEELRNSYFNLCTYVSGVIINRFGAHKFVLSFPECGILLNLVRKILRILRNVDGYVLYRTMFMNAVLYEHSHWI